MTAQSRAECEVLVYSPRAKSGDPLTQAQNVKAEWKRRVRTCLDVADTGPAFVLVARPDGRPDLVLIRDGLGRDVTPQEEFELGRVK